MHAQPVTQSKTWKSDPFSFKRGFFQGDPLGPVIFLLVFNPILQYLQNNSHTGYKLGDMSYVTLPYTDDFCLISTNKTTHRKIIDKIHFNVFSMGIKFILSPIGFFNAFLA